MHFLSGKVKKKCFGNISSISTFLKFYIKRLFCFVLFIKILHTTINMKNLYYFSSKNEEEEVDFFINVCGAMVKVGCSFFTYILLHGVYMSNLLDS